MNELATGPEAKPATTLMYKGYTLLNSVWLEALLAYQTITADPIIDQKNITLFAD